jgi:hypothetical protein
MVPRHDTGRVRKQGVKAGIIEPFPDVFPRSQKDPCLVTRDGSEPIPDGFPLFLTHPSPQHDDVMDAGCKPQTAPGRNLLDCPTV